MIDFQQALSDTFGHERDAALMAELFNRMTNTVMLTNPQREIRWVNKKFEELTGYTLAEIKGKRPHDFLFDPASCEEGSSQFTVQLKCMHKNGTFHWMRVEINPSFDRDNNIIGFTAIGTDITDYVMQRELLLKQYHTLKQVAFTSSHLVRAPLANILSLTNLLQHEPGNDSLVNYLSESAAKLDEAVKDLTHKVYDIYKMESQLIKTPPRTEEK